jgi:hypothetical protein
MIERVVENWLTNAKERHGYEIPFCQCLMMNGYKVLHLSSHGQMEQGKDIIAIDKNGVPCAFQLKAGNITASVWRDIKGEIDELIEIPINHPSINKSVNHRAILVTNGTITDKIRRDIDDRNANFRNKGLPELKIIVHSELLTEFIKVHGSFLPSEPKDFKTFLELFLSNGTDMLNKELFSNFLSSILFENKGTESHPILRQKIASGILLSQYALSPFELKNNHVAVVEGWILLCAHVFGLVEKYKLPEKYWRPSCKLIIQRINEQLCSLKEEVAYRDNYIEGSALGDGDVIYKARMTIAMGWLSALELFQKRINGEYELDDRIYSHIKECYPIKTWFWGESATPFFILMSLFLSEYGDKDLSNSIIRDILWEITIENGGRDGKGIPDPYYDPKEVIGSIFGTPEFEFERKSFLGSSYHLSALVDSLVRRNKRNILNELWMDISYFDNCEFVPETDWHIFLWRNKTGEVISEFYKLPQSWKELSDQAFSKELKLPKILKTNPEFLYYFLLTYPHRLSKDSIKLIDKSYVNCD